MMDWTTPIEDKTKNSKLWKARGNEQARGGCYICGSHEGVKEYAFGRLHIETLEQHIGEGARLVATKRYSYAPPVRRRLCEECLRWEYRNQIGRQHFGVFLFFGIISLVFGIFLANYGGFSNGTGWMVFNIVLFLGAVGFLAGALWELRTRKVFSDDDGDIALSVIFTCVSSNNRHNLGYYTRSESGKAPNDPLKNY